MPLATVAQLDLHALAIDQLHPEALARRRVILRDLHAALGKSEPAHAMRQPRGAKPHLRQLQPLPFPEQHRIRRDHEPVERQFAMPAMLLRPHDRDAPDDAPARLVAVEEERRQPVARIVRGPRDQDEVLGFLRAGDEPLAAVHHVGAIRPAAPPACGSSRGRIRRRDEARS